jgi:hypothetical protein
VKGGAFMSIAKDGQGDERLAREGGNRLPRASFRKSRKRRTREKLDDRANWFRRPRADQLTFDEVSPLADPLLAVENKQDQSELGEELGWSDEHLASFKQMMAEYYRKPTIANYLSLRRTFPGVEIEICRFGGYEGIDALNLMAEFAKLGIDKNLFSAALHGEEPDVDALCLHLIEYLVKRDKNPGSGPGQIQRRRKGDAAINFILAVLLDGYDYMSERAGLYQIPTSLSVLVREQLCGSSPDLYALRLAQEKRENALGLAAQRVLQGEKITVRRLMQIAGTSRMTAARWLSDAEFRKDLGDLVAGWQSWKKLQRAPKREDDA